MGKTGNHPILGWRELGKAPGVKFSANFLLENFHLTQWRKTVTKRRKCWNTPYFKARAWNFTALLPETFPKISAQISKLAQINRFRICPSQMPHSKCVSQKTKYFCSYSKNSIKRTTNLLSDTQNILFWSMSLFKILAILRKTLLTLRCPFRQSWRLDVFSGCHY